MKTILNIGAAVAALAIAATAAGAQAGVLYSQAFDGTGVGFASQNDTNGLGHYATVYDNFKLGSGATITSVGFTGEYFNPPSPGTITGFTLNIWGDSGGQPGSSLYSVSVPGNAGENALGSFGGFPVASYSIATNFNAAAGTTYWLSVVPDLGFPPQWGWSSATGGDSVSYQDFFGARTQVPADMAFTLNGGVPEPATWAMLILGVAMVGFAARRRGQGMAVAA